MAKVEHASDARVLVGIDISKHRHEVLIAVPSKTRRRRLAITNSTDDFMRLIAILREYGLPEGVQFVEADVQRAFEPKLHSKVRSADEAQAEVRRRRSTDIEFFMLHLLIG